MRLPSNNQVERRAAALSEPKLLYQNSSTPSDAQRSYPACPLQRKLGQAMPCVLGKTYHSQTLRSIEPHELPAPRWMLGSCSNTTTCLWVPMPP